MSIRYLPPTFVKYLSTVINQVYSLLHPLILCLACALWGIYALHVTIRAGFNSCYDALDGMISTHVSYFKIPFRMIFVEVNIFDFVLKISQQP